MADLITSAWAANHSDRPTARALCNRLNGMEKVMEVYSTEVMAKLTRRDDLDVYSIYALPRAVGKLRGVLGQGPEDGREELREEMFGGKTMCCCIVM